MSLTMYDPVKQRIYLIQKFDLTYKEEEQFVQEVLAHCNLTLDPNEKILILHKKQKNGFSGIKLISYSYWRLSRNILPTNKGRYISVERIKNAYEKIQKQILEVNASVEKEREQAQQEAENIRQIKEEIRLLPGDEIKRIGPITSSAFILTMKFDSKESLKQAYYLVRHILSV